MRSAAIVVVVLAISLSGKPSQRFNVAQHKSDDQGSPSTVTVVNNEATSPNASNANDGRPKWYASPEWWLAILGFPTLLLIAVQAIQTRKAAVAAKLNADYLRASAAAYLTLAESKENVSIGPGVNPKFKFTILNKGTTPAVKCKASYCTEIVVAEPFGASWDFTDKAYRVELGETSTIDPIGSEPLGGRSMILVDVGRPLTAEEANGLTTGSRVLAVWLSIEFTDVFDRRRYRNFGIYIGAGGGLYLLPKYNDSGDVVAEQKSKKPN